MGTEAIGAEPGRAVARLSRVVERALAELDLSLAQYRLLCLLSESTSSAAAMLADRLAVTRPSVTALVDGMAARGLVERRNCPDDRRRVTHDLTDKGRGVLVDADQAVERRLGRLCEYLPASRTDLAVVGLASWQEALDAHRAALMEKR